MSGKPAQNSAGSAKRVVGRPFAKGVSANPGGRPKVETHVKELARQHTEKAIRTLVKALDDKDGRVRVAAANSLLDRGFGRPAAIDEAGIIREELALLTTAVVEAMALQQVPKALPELRPLAVGDADHRSNA